MSTKKLSRRDFLRISALSAAGAALAGCGAPTPEVVKETVEVPLEQTVEVEKTVIVEQTVVVEPTTAPVELVVVTDRFHDNQPDRGREELDIASFNERMAAEGIPYRVEAELGPSVYEDFETKLTVDAAAGTMPDITHLVNRQFADFVAAGYLADLTPYVTAWDGWQHIYPVLREGSTIDGKVYWVPRSVGTMNIFYRKDVMEEAGISTAQPQTYDDFYALCDEIVTKTDAMPCGFPAGLQWGGGSWGESFKFIWLGFAENNEIYDPADERWVVKSDGLLGALGVIETLATNGWLTVDMLLSPNPWVPIKYEGFPQGTVMFVTGGHWQWTFDWGPEGQTPIEGLFEKVDTWLFPSEISEPFVYTTLGGGYVVSANSEHPDAAFEYVKHVLDPEVTCKNSAAVDHNWGPTSRDDVTDVCEYYRTAVNGKLASASSEVIAGRTMRAHVGEGKISDGVARVTESIITGEATAEEAMEEFAREMTESLGEDAVKEL